MACLSDYDKRLRVYAERLRVAAVSFNLVSRLELDRIELHILDSIMAFNNRLKMNELEEQAALGIDIGSGAGMPGIVLSVLFPEISWVLLESRKKRLDFLNETLSQLGISNARAVRGRVEELGHESPWRASANIATARAVAPFPVLAEIGVPLLKVGGRLLCMKGHQVKQEIDGCVEFLDSLGASVEDIHTYESPLGGTRAVVSIRKDAETPDHFPRSAQRLRQESKRFHLKQAKQEDCFT
ncbi:MAG TPA: 16S rRNA (guanine(527)-N(7))-methyltransferase RsmG [bacterium]|nr:16S rRNA (guanine(527)-N(7))-methyltransferase RsmG [bacterium]